MGRNGYGPKWLWADIVMGRNGYGPKWRVTHTKFQEYRLTSSGEDFWAFLSMKAMLSMEPLFLKQNFALRMHKGFISHS